MSNQVTSEDWVEPTKRSRRCSIIREFCSNTSAHALPGIARSQSKANRLFWIFSFIAFLGIMIYFVVSSILTYYTYPKQTNIEYPVPWPQAFPAVSICNAFPVRRDLIEKELLNFTNAASVDQVSGEQMWSYMIGRSNNNQTMRPFFYALDTMLYKCAMNKNNCSSADFIPFESSQYGLCHTFNAKKKEPNSTIIDSQANGGNGELELGFYIHSHQYLPNIHDGK
jgi:hypothetical protein